MRKDGENWIYSKEVEDHFFNPRNVMKDEKEFNADAIGETGSPACGDVMTVWIKIEDDKIKECKWKTFGCASAIASISIMSEMITENGGMKISEAKNLKPQQIIERLGGLPDRKFHCSVLGQEALREAINNYESKRK